LPNYESGGEGLAAAVCFGGDFGLELAILVLRKLEAEEGG
jgi:hypothetical protein